MKNIQAMAGGSVGWVRGVFSSRQRGVAFPLDLVRSMTRVAARVGVRRRLAAEFSGYLAGVAVATEKNRNGTEAAPGRKENVTVSDWLDRTRRALDQLQGVK